MPKRSGSSYSTRRRWTDADAHAALAAMSPSVLSGRALAAARGSTRSGCGGSVESSRQRATGLRQAPKLGRSESRRAAPSLRSGVVDVRVLAVATDVDLVGRDHAGFLGSHAGRMPSPVRRAATHPRAAACGRWAPRPSEPRDRPLMLHTQQRATPGDAPTLQLRPAVAPPPPSPESARNRTILGTWAANPTPHLLSRRSPAVGSIPVRLR